MRETIAKMEQNFLYPNSKVYENWMWVQEADYLLTYFNFIVDVQ